jgi:hypothetical protein
MLVEKVRTVPSLAVCTYEDGETYSSVDPSPSSALMSVEPDDLKRLLSGPMPTVYNHSKTPGEGSPMNSTVIKPSNVLRSDEPEIVRV